MKIIALRPSVKLIKHCFIAVALVVLARLLADEQVNWLLIATATIASLICLFDLASLFKPVQLKLSRQLPNNLSFSRWHECQLVIDNLSNRTIKLQAAEHISNEFELVGLERVVSVKGSNQLKLGYQLKANKRGAFSLTATELVFHSSQGYWQCHRLDELVDEFKVYPDFKRLNQQGLKGINNLPINGLKQLKKRGEGIEFHQLREFRQGDSLRQIDWQATSKRQKLISKEYQEEQNQHVIVMLDAGVKMKIETEQGSHFDAALNALLMLGHTVLKQGDWFSMQSFNQQERWLAAVKGAQNVSMVMNHFYDLHPDNSASDYIKASHNLLAKRSKRALVLMVTTLGDQDFDALLPALKQLQQHHLVALINIENIALRSSLQVEVNDTTSANEYAAAVVLKNQYQAYLKRLSKEGILVVDCQPQYLLPYVINTYLSVKNAGLL